MCPSLCASMYTAPVYKGWPSSSLIQCTRSVQVCTHAVHKLDTRLGTCVHFQAVSKLGHSNFYSSVVERLTAETVTTFGIRRSRQLQLSQADKENISVKDQNDEVSYTRCTG